MGVIIRQSVYSTAVTFIGIAIGYFSVLWLMPYCLDPEQIGLIRLIQNMGMLFAAFAHLGMTNVVAKYYNYFKGTEDQDSFVFQIIFIPLIGLIAFTIVYVLLQNKFIAYFENKSALLVQYYWHLLAFTFIVTYFNVLVSYSRSLMRNTVPALLKEVVFRVSLVVLILLFFISTISLTSLVNGIIISYVMLTIILVVYVQFIRPQQIKISFSSWQSAHAKEIRTFALYSMLHGASGILIINIDSIMLSGMTGLSNFGIYSIAFTISMVVEIPRRSISFTAFPALAEAWKKLEMDRIKLFHQKASINQTLAGILIFLLIWVNIDYLFDIMPNGDIYKTSKWVIVIIAGSKLLELATGLSGEVITGSKYFFYNLVFTSLLVFVAIITNWWLIPLFGINGAATASCISIVAFTVAKTIFIGVKFKLHPFSKELLITITLGAFLFFATLLIPSISNPYFGIIINTLIVGLVYLIAAYKLNLSQEYVHIWKKIKSRIM